MPTLAFTTMQDKVESGEKRQTIRKNAGYWTDAYLSGQKAHIWLGSPRRGKNRARKLGITEIKTVLTVQGKDLTEKDAHKDGFKHRSEMLLTLARLNHMSADQAMEHRWAVIKLGKVAVKR